VFGGEELPVLGLIADLDLEERDGGEEGGHQDPIVPDAAAGTKSF
jgi:hypothetical protein